MKRITYLIFAALLLGACTGHRNPSYTPKQLYSVDTIADIIASDTIHSKLFVFSSWNCAGCINYFKTDFIEALAQLDTSKWRLYCIDCDEIKDETYQTSVCQYFKQYGFGRENILFMNKEYPSVKDLKEFVSLFKTVPSVELNLVSAVPQTFMVDRHGYLCIMKMYTSEKKDSFHYRSEYFDKYWIDSLDFSKENPNIATLITHD